jgi:hypothetical protein
MQRQESAQKHDSCGVPAGLANHSRRRRPAQPWRSPFDEYPRCILIERAEREVFNAA